MVVRGLYTWALDHDRGTSILDSCRGRRAKARSTAGRTWTHTRSAEAGLGAHAVEFSKTAAPSVVGGLPTQHARQALAAPAGRTENYSAARAAVSAGNANEAHKAPLADTQHAPVQRLGGQVQRVDDDRVERDRTLVDQPPRLGARESEALGDQRRYVHGAAVGSAELAKKKAEATGVRIEGFTASELADVESALTWIAQNREAPGSEAA